MDKGKDKINYDEADVKIQKIESKNSINYSMDVENSEETDNTAEKNINDIQFEDEPYTAPVEVFAEFLSTLMSRNYNSALYYCKLILLYEPDNEVAQDFYPLIQEKIHLYNNASVECGENDESESSTQSESSTEYFSSSFVGSENMSSSNSSEDSSE